MREVIISTHIFLEHLVRSALCPLMRMRRHLDFVVTTKLSDGQHTSQSQYTPSITLSSFLIIPTKIDRNVGPSSSCPLLLLLSRQSIFTIQLLMHLLLYHIFSSQQSALLLKSSCQVSATPPQFEAPVQSWTHVSASYLTYHFPVPTS